MQLKLTNKKDKKRSLNDKRAITLKYADSEDEEISILTLNKKKKEKRK